MFFCIIIPFILNRRVNKFRKNLKYFLNKPVLVYHEEEKHIGTLISHSKKYWRVSFEFTEDYPLTVHGLKIPYKDYLPDEIYPAY
jgi:hypothetical protein